MIRGAGGIRFLVKGYLCDLVEVLKDTLFDQGLRERNISLCGAFICPHTNK